MVHFDDIVFDETLIAYSVHYDQMYDNSEFVKSLHQIKSVIIPGFSVTACMGCYDRLALLHKIPIDGEIWDICECKNIFLCNILSQYFSVTSDEATSVT